jgi:hypothetical protein
VETDAEDREMIDAEAYQKLLWDQSFTAHPTVGFTLWVAPDIDVQTLDELPALTWNLSSDANDMNGPDAWNFILNANVFGDGMDQAKSAMRHVDSLVQEWFEDPGPTVIDVDGDRIAVADGETLDYPSRQATSDLPARLVVQYSASYRLLMRSTRA